MPQVMVTKEDSFFYAPMDRLYIEVLRPYFQKSLKKHSLTSLIDLNIAMKPLEPSKIYALGEVQILVKAITDNKFDHLASKQETHIGKDLFEDLRNTVVFDTSKNFKIANYYR